VTSPSRLPPGLSFGHPVAVIATVGGVGLLPRAPGTWGSLVALPPAWLIVAQWGWLGLLLGVVLVTLIGVWVADRFTQRAGVADPGIVVIDEVAGQWFALAALPLDPFWYAAGFVAFRFFDIVKPWPVSWADRSLRGGLGVMVDDLLAGLYAVLVLLIALWLTDSVVVF